MKDSNKSLLQKRKYKTIYIGKSYTGLLLIPH